MAQTSAACDHTHTKIVVRNATMLLVEDQSNCIKVVVGGVNCNDSLLVVAMHEGIMLDRVFSM